MKQCYIGAAMSNARNLHLNATQRSFFRPTEAAHRIRAG
jgi:hypothetical protein